MSHRLRMSAELGDWFTELGSSQPGPSQAAAEEVAASLVAVLEAADSAALGIVADLAAEHADDPGEHRAAIDYTYQQLLEAQSVLRGQVAEAATWRSSSRRRFSTAGSEPLPLTPDEVAAFEARERSLQEQSQRFQSAIDHFRAVKEAAKARLTAAHAGREIQLALLASAAEAGLTPEETADVRRDLARAEANLVDAAEQIAAARAEASRTAHRVLRGARQATISSSSSIGQSADSADGDGDPDVDIDEDADEAAKAVPAGLLELRADPLGSDARLLYAVEPAGTVTLLAVLDDIAAVAAHRGEAIDLAGELLEEIRADGWPGASGAPDTAATDAANDLVTLAGAAAFLDRYFGGRQSGITERAAVLATARTLADLRRARDLSIADVATRSGLSAGEVRQLESGGVRPADVGDLALYLGALGRRLDLTTEGVPLR